MRNGLQVLKERNIPDMIGVEIGVWRGQNAECMLKHMPNIKMLYLVDSYIQYPEYNLNEIWSHTNMESNKRHAEDLLKPYADRITWVIKKAHDAKDDIPDDLDFVYIDGSHCESAIKEDMADYYPKVKAGGFFSGHDICQPDIRPSIDQFARDRGYEICLYDKPENQTWDQAGCDMMDWWYVK